MSRVDLRTGSGIRTSAFMTAFGCLILSAAISGCSSSRVIRSDGVASWAGLGVQVTLPEGTWRVRSSEKDQAATFFPEGRRGSLALFRVKVAPAAPDQLAFRRLFAYFPDKKEISIRRIVLPGGRTAECAEYEVKTKAGATRVKAYALRHDDWTYELAAWGFEGETPAEPFLAGLEFAE